MASFLNKKKPKNLGPAEGGGPPPKADKKAKKGIRSKKQKNNKKGKGKATGVRKRVESPEDVPGYKKETPKLPFADLTPSKSKISDKKRSIRLLTVAGLAGVVALTAVSYAVTEVSISTANGNLTQAQESASSKEKEIAPYTAAEKSLGALTARQSLANSVAAGLPDYNSTLNLLQKTEGSGIKYIQISIRAKSAPGGSDASTGAAPAPTTDQEFAGQCGPVTDPFGKATPPINACLKITGSAQSAAAAANLTTTLKNSPLLANVYITQTITPASGGKVSFDGSAVLLSKKAG